MAEGGPIDRPDIITDDALKAPGIMTDELKKLLDSMDAVVKKSQEYATVFSSSDASTSKLKESTAGLTDEQKVLAQITTQITTLTAKQSDKYIQQVAIYNNLKQAVKDKTALGDQEAQSITRENASRNQLLAALNSNRAAYSNLRSEQERNSPTGQALLKTIQDQFKAYSDLSTNMGVNQQKVGAYRSELEDLLVQFGRVSPIASEAGDKLGLIGKLGQAVFSPLGVTIAAIAGAIGITKAALDVFYEDSIQGQDELNGKFNFFKATLEVVKDALFNFGKAASSWLDGLGEFVKSGLISAFPQLLSFFTLAEVKQEKLNEVTHLQNEIRKEEIKLTVEGSALELEKQEELYTAREKAHRQLEDRYDALQKAKVLQKEEVDLQLNAVNNEIALQQRVIQVNASKNVIGLTANQILEQANELGRVNYEQVEKLAQLEAKRNQILGEQFQGQRRVQSLEATLLQEQNAILIEGYKARLAASDAADAEEFKAEQTKDNLVLQNQKASLRAKLEALIGYYNAQANLDDIAKYQEIRTEKEKFVVKAQLTKEGYDEIKNQAGGNLKEFARLEQEAKEDIVENDKTFNQVRDSIFQKFESKKLEDKKKFDKAYLTEELNHQHELLTIEQQVTSTFAASAQKITDEQFQSLQDAISNRQTALTDAYNKEIALAGNNADAKAVIDKKYAADQKKLQDEASSLKIKQAIFDKEATLLQLGLKEAFAIAELLPYFNNPATAAWASLQLEKTIALATLEEAAVAAKPLPKYDIGTQDHPGGFAQVHPGELMEINGQLMMTPQRPAIVDLPEHSKVFTMQETTRMLALLGLGVPERSDRVQRLEPQILNEIRKTNQLLNKPQQKTYVNDGVAIIEAYKAGENLVRRIRKNVMIGNQ